MAKLRVLSLFLVFWSLQVLAGFQSPSGDAVKPLSVDQKVNELSVLWWNTACGAHEKPAERQAQFENLAELTRKENQVDVILLGEYCPRSMPKALIEKLRKTYPQAYYVPYTVNNLKLAYIGFGIFSRRALKVNLGEALDWLPINASPEEKTKAEALWKSQNAGTALFPRSYNPISVTKAGKTFNIIPVHLAHPWQTYLRRHKDSPIRQKTAVAKELMFGEDNPLVWQLDQLLAKVQRDFSPIEEKNLMLIGDFNFPLHIPAVIGPSVLPYRRIKDAGFSDGMDTSDISHRDTKLKIDHAFVSDQIRPTKTEVLPISGSDHFPIFLQLK